MNITKLGHCCLLVEEAGLRILTDPGMFSVGAQENAEGLDAIVITHEHADHLHADSLRKILQKNPRAKIIGNSSVGKLLKDMAGNFIQVEDGEKAEVGGLVLSGHGRQHAEIYEDFGQVENTGYFIGRRLFYPGDAFYNPGRQVEILALPVAGPWMKVSEAVDYGKAISPKVCFPVHDGMLKAAGSHHLAPEKFLKAAGIDFRPLSAGEILQL